MPLTRWVFSHRTVLTLVWKSRFWVLAACAAVTIGWVGIALGTVKAQIHRARALMKEALER